MLHMERKDAQTQPLLLGAVLSGTTINDTSNSQPSNYAYPKTLHLLFKGKYNRWSAVSIKRPFLLKGRLTAPYLRNARLIR